MFRADLPEKSLHFFYLGLYMSLLQSAIRDNNANIIKDYYKKTQNTVCILKEDKDFPQYDEVVKDSEKLQIFMSDVFYRNSGILSDFIQLGVFTFVFLANRQSEEDGIGLNKIASRYNLVGVDNWIKRVKEINSKGPTAGQASVQEMEDILRDRIAKNFSIHSSRVEEKNEFDYKGDNKMNAREIKNCRSEIDKSRSITPDSCVLSLARKVDAGNRQHVFMVLEGITDGNRFAWYADLTMRGNQPPDNKFSRINIDEKDSKDFQKKLLPEIDKNALRDVSFAAQIWNIDKTDAMELKEAVRREKKEWEDSRRNVPYQILGNESKSAHSSSQGGHNCFTWAREKINKLKIDEVNVPVSLFDWVGTLPSYHIPDPRKNMNSFWTPQRVAVVGMVGIGVGVAASRCTIL